MALVLLVLHQTAWLRRLLAPRIPLRVLLHGWLQQASLQFLLSLLVVEAEVFAVLVPLAVLVEGLAIETTKRLLRAAAIRLLLVLEVEALRPLCLLLTGIVLIFQVLLLLTAAEAWRAFALVQEQFPAELSLALEEVTAALQTTVLTALALAAAEELAAMLALVAQEVLGGLVLLEVAVVVAVAAALQMQTSHRVALAAASESLVKAVTALAAQAALGVQQAAVAALVVPPGVMLPVAHMAAAATANNLVVALISTPEMVVPVQSVSSGPEILAASLLQT